MYAVIFKAEVASLDEEYSLMANQLRELALTKYGCKEFIACNEGNTELAISYWKNEEQIKQWKQNTEHLMAQRKGQSTWYKSYTVQVVKVIREYNH